MAVEDISAHVDLAYASDLLASGGPAAMYNYLASNGYLYANLANGVANGGSLAGDAALSHMQEVAAESGHPLTVADINKIRSDMAIAYLDALLDKQDNGDFSDITWREAWTFHSQTFIQNHLPPDAWTLNTPFSVMTDAERADLWQRSLEAAGDPGKEAALAFTLAAAMSDQAGLLSAASPDENFVRELAEGLTEVRPQSPEQIATIQHWLAINAASLNNTQNFFDALGQTSGRFIESVKAQIKVDSGAFIDVLRKMVNDAEALGSPLILDLDGDGVETTGLSAHVHFDHDTNGFAESTGWVGRDDGLLVFDRNGNGRIDNGTELFGDNTKLPSGDKAANGFAALAALDTNGDGRIDASDTDYASLRVWKDIDSDGETDDGELITLSQAGVQSIGVNYVANSVTDLSGNQHLQVGTYTRLDGSAATVEDIWFATDLARTVDQNEITISESIATMPDISGMGNVHSLRQAMARDTSGVLVSLVKQFELASDVNIRNSLVDQILISWTGADQHSVGTRGYVNEGRKLYVIEAFLGKTFTQQNGSADPGPDAAETLLRAYNFVSESVRSQLMLQTHLKPAMDMLSIKVESGVVAWDVSAFLASIRTQYATAPASALQSLQEFTIALKSSGFQGATAILKALSQQGNINGSDLDAALTTLNRPGQLGSGVDDTLSGKDTYDGVMYGLSGNDTLKGFSGNDYLSGGLGDDTLDGGKGNNQLFGDEGNDLLKVDSDSNNNLLSGGVGDDQLFGSSYADTYLFNEGDGKDVITENDAGHVATDTLRFGAGIHASDINLQRVGSDLVFKHRNGTDQVTVKGLFDGTTSSTSIVNQSVIERVEFADGTSWTWADMIAAGLNQTGTSRSDALVGWNGNDIIHGGSGDDTLDGGSGSNQLYGDAGNDDVRVTSNSRDNILAGGAGNDTLTGGYFSDTYLFNLGDGQDTISEYDPGYGSTDVLRFGAGILASDILMRRTGPDLIFLHRNGTDQVTLKGLFDGATSDTTAISQTIIERVEFADGTFWTWSDMVAQGLSQTGSAGADALVGFNGNDIIHGGDGDDTVDGGAGSNQLFGDAGNDVIQVAYNSRNNTLAGGAGNDTLKGGYFSDTYLFNLGDGQDTISEYDPGYGSTDVLRFGAGILASDILMRRTGPDLIFLHRNGTDQVTLKGLFDGATSDTTAISQTIIERVEFADGTFWTWSDMVAQGLSQTGSAGADALVGFNGNDIIHGGDGDDTVDGGAGSNQLFGDAGNDVIQVAYNSRNNTLAGGAGNDTLKGGYFSDTYLFNLGDGQDTISEYDPGYGGTDVLRFGAGILTSDITMRRVGSDLLLLHRNGTDQVTVKGLFDDATANASVISQSVIERVEFADGTSWTWTDMIATGLNQVGTAGADALIGWNGNDIIHGGSGDDTLDGAGGTNQLFGDAGNDVIQVAYNARDSVLAGGAGNDTLTGSYFSDTYLFNRGDGQDRINEYSPGYGATDTLAFGADVSPQDLWFRQSGSNLEISLIGGDDKLTISNWYESSVYHVEVLKTADGKTLLDSQVQSLVNTMASFGVAPGAETTITNDQRAQLDTALAANWK
ncbi:hypothetical protein FGE05_06290 [Pseudomonas sp. ICMP22404]|uniref:calcium-binding protein n=1 Tax=Pseudomonas sp. ICMP22404 TaxID=2583807 RepID=UPI001119A244|nr:calcium-binding protein [Pseudomonas sp. ICMP22404]TNF83810.1 hypothetical protein FGE05_06290 [Pseudomonas sp. ICMP22404]